MLVYMALARFGKPLVVAGLSRPLRASQLPCALRADIRAFFGTYAKACRQADELLFRAGDASAIDEIRAKGVSVFCSVSSGSKSSSIGAWNLQYGHDRM